MLGSSPELPPGYYLEKDPDILVLRRLDGSMVGAFSARGAAPDAVRRTAEETTRPASPVGRETPDPVDTWPLPRVRFFGHFELRRDGETMPPARSGKALTILKYLLASRSRPVSQDHLTGWLWPESGLKKARWSLNSAFHGLRKLLGNCPSSDSTSRIPLDEGHYRICSTVAEVTDVDEFDASHERGRLLE